MIYIHKIDDLNPFGIRALTGEACRVGHRILCDLTDDGRKIVADLLGIHDRHYAKYPTFAEPWNGNGATASFMLPRGLFIDLAVWCLIHKGCPQIMLVYPGSGDGYSWGTEVIGFESADSDSEWAELKDLYEGLGKKPRIIRNNTNLPGHGTRCTHAMSGRTT